MSAFFGLLAPPDSMKGITMRCSRVLRLLLPILVAVAGCNDKTTPTPPTQTSTTSTTTTTVPNQPNTPPVIDSLTASPVRAEFRTDTAIAASVRDAETPVGNLRYTWSTSRGTISGAGARVTHRYDQPPPQQSPVNIDVTLVVTEDLPNGQTNTATRTLTFPLHDSFKEARDLTNQFLGDFINPLAGPDFVVRNFSERCRGKIDERENVRVNRSLYEIDRERSKFAITEVTFVGNPPLRNDFGNVKATCNFVSRVRSTGRTEFANGICSLDVFFDTDRWMLCDSSFAGTSTVVGLGLHPGANTR
jgi:hypothetical protein